MSLDRIELGGLRAFGRHGANRGEKDVPQAFDIDVVLDVDLRAARAGDALADTIDYAALHAVIVRIVRERSFDLLERLGQEILDAIVADARIVRASVRLAKPGLLGGATPAVTVRAERA